MTYCIDLYIAMQRKTRHQYFLKDDKL